jgi:thioredoxin-like negative regulator of GroEL
VARNPNTLKQAIEALSQVLRENTDPQARAKAAECLGELANAEALTILCEALPQERTPDVQISIMDAIVTLAKPDSDKTMSETPKYDLRGANIGNFAETIQSGGRQEATQNIYAPEQDFDKLLTDYQQFFNSIQQKYPAQTPEAALQPIIDAEFQELQKTQPQRWQNFLNLKRLWNGGKKATFKMGEHFAQESLWGKMAIAFLEGIVEDSEL